MQNPTYLIRVCSKHAGLGLGFVSLLMLIIVVMMCRAERFDWCVFVGEGE